MAKRTKAELSEKSLLRPFTIVAQDPSVRLSKKPLFTQVMVPAETLAPGPWGYRLQVIDYDSSTQTLYKAWADTAPDEGCFEDPFADSAAKDPESLLQDPKFHQCNAYAISMRILARFEQALGRRVSWQFKTHQLKIAPHAFAEANAYYSRRDECLLFGYFPGKHGPVFSCLSHDVVAHETTHALVDGLRQRFLDPSSPDQAAFHEGFCDVVSLLSVFALRDVVDAALRLTGRSNLTTKLRRKLVNGRVLTAEAMRESILLSLAEQMGQEMSLVRGRPLRASARLSPGTQYLTQAEFQLPHRRGEIFVAAMMQAFLAVVEERIRGLSAESFDDTDTSRPIWLDRTRVLEEAAKAADHLLTIAIRALDYTMPVHLTFADYLSAMLTADREVVGDDGLYGYRPKLLASFQSYGINPASDGDESGVWLSASKLEGQSKFKKLRYGGIHFRSLQTDVDEVFRFLWENRVPLELTDEVYTRVLSVRPCVRLSPDGFFLQETVAEYVQIIDLTPPDLHRVKIRVPKAISRSMRIRLTGGGTLIFDEYGKLKFHVHNHVLHARKQAERIDFLWNNGWFRDGRSMTTVDFSGLHRQRILDSPRFSEEAWQ